MTSACTLSCTHSCTFRDGDSLVNRLADDDTELCVICQEEITTDPTCHSVNMGCMHRFHGQCLVNHLLRDIRCPVCRHDPTSTPESDDDELSTEGEIDTSVTRKAALKLARKDKKNKSTLKSLATIKKWKDTKSNANGTMREINAKLQPMYDSIERDVEMFEEKLTHDMEFDNREEIKKRDACKKNMAKAITAIRNAETRLAQKYGFVRRRFSRSRRINFANL